MNRKAWKVKFKDGTEVQVLTEMSPTITREYQSGEIMVSFGSDGGFKLSEITGYWEVK